MMLANITNTPQGDPQSPLPGFQEMEARVVIYSQEIFCYIGLIYSYLYSYFFGNDSVICGVFLPLMCSWLHSVSRAFLVCSNSWRIIYLFSLLLLIFQLQKNGLRKNGILKNGLICDFKFGPWKNSTFKPTIENDDTETSSSDTSDDDDV